jgi:hypothetical protein
MALYLRAPETPAPKTKMPAFAGILVFGFDSASAAFTALAEVQRPISSLKLSSWPSFSLSPCWLSN